MTGYGAARPGGRGAWSERVVLVDADGAAIGTEDKLRTHELGLRHRAFSVFLFDGAGRLLLQRRAAAKYHSGGLWSNTCCSHPRPGEPTLDAAHRRLREEMGIDGSLRAAFSFTYRVGVGGGLIEHEHDQVFVGRTDARPHPDPAEAAAWRWAEPRAIDRDVYARPLAYTPWFRIAWRTLSADPDADRVIRAAAASAPPADDVSHRGRSRPAAVSRSRRRP